MKITRADLPDDPRDAYRVIGRRIAEHRRDLQRLLTVRGEVLREIAGDGRGAVARVADVMGVTHVRAGRILLDDLLRAVHDAARAAGLKSGDYLVREMGQSYPPRVAMSLVDDTVYPAEDEEWDERDPHDRDRQRDAEQAAWYGLANAAGALCAELRRRGLSCVGDGRAVDVAGYGPTHTLARLEEVTVTWASQADD